MSDRSEMPIRVERVLYPDGTLKEETHYRGESCHGPWRQWHPNGVMAREWWYDKHVLADGVHRTWFPNGQLETVRTFRDGRLLSEIAFNERGKRVPTYWERMIAQERKLMEKAAAKAALAVPPKLLRRMTLKEKESAAAHTAELLSGRTAPAKQWLSESTEEDERALGDWDTELSVRFVELMFELGTVDVLAANISEGPPFGANDVLITLPADPSARARVLAFDRAVSRRNGFSSEGDWGQTHRFVHLA